MKILQAQGLHHVTLMGADRATSIGFWQGVLGMPFVFEQPNLDNPAESHLYFDPGDGRLITIFCDDARKPAGGRTNADPGAVHHIAFAVSQAMIEQAAERLTARGIGFTGPKDRGFMSSIYFREPLGLLIELAAWTFAPPEGTTHTEVLIEAHKQRVAAGDAAIARVHVADAITAILGRRERL